MSIEMYMSTLSKITCLALQIDNLLESRLALMLIMNNSYQVLGGVGNYGTGVSRRRRMGSDKLI